MKYPLRKFTFSFPLSSSQQNRLPFGTKQQKSVVPHACQQSRYLKPRSAKQQQHQQQRQQRRQRRQLLREEAELVFVCLMISGSKVKEPNQNTGGRKKEELFLESDFSLIILPC